MVLTARGRELAEPVAQLLEHIRSAIALPQPFNPASSDREISIMASDYALKVVLRPLLVLLDDEAPRMKFEISPLGDNVVDELRRGRADVLIALDTVISTELPSIPLWEDSFVAIVWSGNRFVKDRLTRELYEELGHVVPRFGKTRVPSFEELALKSLAVNRRCEVIAPNFTAMPTLVVETQRIATLHRKLAERMARYLPIRLLELPFGIPVVRPSAQWSAGNANDPALNWFIDRLRELAAEANF